MAKLSIAELVAAIKELSVLELNDLVKSIEKEFGVTAAAPVAAAAAAPVADEGPKAPTEVTVFIANVGPNKVPVLKVVQAITGLGLLDAKKLVDVVPAKIKEKISPAEADDIKAKLVEAGATVEVK